MKINDFAFGAVAKLVPNMDEDVLREKCAHLTRMGLCKQCVHIGFASEEGELECSGCKQSMTELSQDDIDNALEVD